MYNSALLHLLLLNIVVVVVADKFVREELGVAGRLRFTSGKVGPNIFHEASIRLFDCLFDQLFCLNL